MREIGINGAFPRIIMCAATGSGKTVIAAHLIELALAKGASILFLCHRRELIFQCSGKLSENGSSLSGGQVPIDCLAERAQEIGPTGRARRVGRT